MALEEAGRLPCKVRVFVIDDHPIVRQGLSQLINQEADLVVCGEAADGVQAVAGVLEVQPDIVVLDLSLGEAVDGLELIKALRKEEAKVPVLVLSMHDETRYAERALRAGATGYIMKQEATGLLLGAIRLVVKGEIYVSEKVAKRLVQQLIGAADVSEKSPVDELTDREFEIFGLIGKGRGTRQIAEELHLSIKTVESHEAHIKEKLLLKNARELVQRAVEWVTAEGSHSRGLTPGHSSEIPVIRQPRFLNAGQ